MKQRVKILFAGGVLALTLFGGATAEQFEDGLAAYRGGDYPHLPMVITRFAACRFGMRE
jgi:hypothetical protein